RTARNQEPRSYRQERCELLASVRRKLGNGTVSPLAHGPDSAHSTKRGAPPFRRLNPCEALQIRVLSNQFSNIYAGILFESPDEQVLTNFRLASQLTFLPLASALHATADLF